MLNSPVGVGRAIAGLFGGSRKVRAPKGGMLANGKAGRPDGQCNRKHTADGRPWLRATAGTGKGEMVR